MTDDDFVRAVQDGSLPPDRFHHRDHLRLSWCLIRQLGAEPAAAAVAATIQRYAAHHGQAAKYHETLTRFWVRILVHCMAARPDLGTFDDFIADYPVLLDKHLPYRHWRRETMDDATARHQWVEPDLLPLPA
jgi:hypothetical protein